MTEATTEEAASEPPTRDAAPTVDAPADAAPETTTSPRDPETDPEHQTDEPPVAVGTAAPTAQLDVKATATETSLTPTTKTEADAADGHAAVVTDPGPPAARSPSGALAAAVAAVAAGAGDVEAASGAPPHASGDLAPTAPATAEDVVPGGVAPEAQGVDAATPDAPPHLVDETHTGTATGDGKGWKRPPLDVCTPEDFMLDFMRFTDSRGDDWEVVWDTLDNSLRRSGRPMDALGFYKEICSRGGFVSRNSAKARIKMPEAFKVLHNYYPGHTYTDIGNNLLNTYERFFLPYEEAHPEDKIESACTQCSKNHAEKSGGMVSCDGCAKWYHYECCAANTLWRSKGEQITSYLCLVCSHMESMGLLEVPGDDGKKVKKSRKAIDEEAVTKIDEYFERHVSMCLRRGRKYDPNYVKPMRKVDDEDAK